MGERKTRSDKKREVRPRISIELKDAIYRLSYITHTPVKDICEFMCVYLINDEQTVNMLSSYFKRNIRLNNTLYYGSLDNISVNKRVGMPTERVAIKFKQPDYEIMSIVSYAMDCSASRVAAVLLEMALSDMRVLNMYITQHLHEELTPSQIKDLRNLLSYLNTDYEENSSWASLMSLIMDEVTTPINRIKDAVGEFLVNIRKWDDE